MTSFKPPKFAVRFLYWYCDPELLEEIEGDLNEEFEAICSEKGYRKGKLFYVSEVMRFLRMYKPKKRIKNLNTIDMLFNYINIAIRGFRKNRIFSLINIFGLSVGLCCCFLIGLYLNGELSYDKFHKNADNIYRVTRLFKSSDGTTGLHLSRVAPPFATYMRTDFEQIEKIGRFVNYGGIVKYEDKVFNEPNFLWADAEVVDILTFEAVLGDVETALTQPGSVILSETMSAKYFGEENPIGKTISYNNQTALLVRGVFKDFPSNSSYTMDLLADFSNIETAYGGREQLIKMWYRNQFTTLFTLKNSSDLDYIKSGMSAFLTRHLGENATDFAEIQIQKFTDIHLKSNLSDEQGLNGDFTYIYLFSAIAILILMIACINYMNLATAKSVNRAKEVGMRKVFGAAKGNLISQFLVESILLVFMAVLVAFGMSLLILPSFRGFTDMAFDLGALWNWSTILIVIVLSIMVGIMAGSYPAFFLTRFRILNVLKGKVASGSRSGALRKFLVVTQFTISVVLIISTIVIFQQLNFIQNKSLGYEKDQMMILSSNQEIQNNYQALKSELLKLSGVEGVTNSIFVPSNQLLNSRGTASIEVDGELKSTETGLKDLTVGYDFIETYKMELLEGRGFSENVASDSANFILNEAAVNQIGWANAQEAVGQNIEYGGIKGLVIGVLKDFHFESLQSEIQPTILALNNTFRGNLSIKLDARNIRETIGQIETLHTQFAPGFPISFNFLDDRFTNLYQSEEQRSQLFTIFSGLAIFLACLGLFGLTSYTVSQRGKEISIRKVLGSSVNHIIGILSKEFIVLVIVSMILAIPVAWYFMRDWLSSYAYRIELSWLPFVSAGVIVAGIALITITTQTFRAAMTNPVNRLRDQQ